MGVDFERLLNTPWFAIDQLANFSGLLAFVGFSEKNIEWQKKVELQRVKTEMKNIELDEPNWSSLYDHKREGVLFRFDVALPMRVRYAAPATLIASIEWSMTVVRPSFHIPTRPRGVSPVVHLLGIFAERCSLRIDDNIKQLEFLVWVRNSIMHNCGVLKGYKHATDIRNHISAYEPDFVISNWHFIGETVEIKRGALDKLIKSWSETIRDIYKTATEKELLRFDR